jgi:hypothetical protein
MREGYSQYWNGEMRIYERRFSAISNTRIRCEMTVVWTEIDKMQGGDRYVETLFKDKEEELQEAVARNSLTPKLVKVARELLGWTISDLCLHSQLGYSTVADYEREGRQHTWEKTKNAIARTLMAHGIEFVPGGLRLRDTA